MSAMSVLLDDVRADLVFAHDHAWSALSQPGTWWSGAQRRELARTAMLAVSDVDPSPPWVAASTVSANDLQINFVSSAAHDAVYRIARHAATLTKDWYQRTTQEIDPLAFVELCGIVCTVATVVAFRRALDLEIPELAPAIPGEPSRIKPANVVDATLN